MTLTLTQFLEPFFPSDNEPVWLFGFAPKSAPENMKGTTFQQEATRKMIAENKLFQNNLIHHNKTKGLYFIVNSGGTLKEEIKRVNAVFCEKDDLPMEDQHDLFDNCPFPPSIRVETKKSVHAYWMLNEVLSVEQFKQIQFGLIDYFQSDEKIKNENRLMRLPFLNHVDFVNGEYSYKRVNVHTFTPEIKFSFQELKESFPAKEIIRPEYIKPDNLDSLEAVKTELRIRIFAHSTFKIERGSGWATCAGVCHGGKGNTAIAVNLASGFVHCQKGCDFKQILDAFGLELPKPDFIKWKQRTQQSSATYQMLKNYVKR